jgi:hypothetical protein
MTTMETDHCQIVTQSLSGQRGADEQTFSSIAVLSDRLDQLRKMHRAFIDIEFSPEVQVLSQQEMMLALS